MKNAPATRSAIRRGNGSAGGPGFDDTLPT
jgi:hypothetical protein